MGHTVYQFLQKPDFSVFTALSVVLDSIWVTDFGNIYHYAGRIRILWQMLGGGVNSLIGYGYT